MTEKYLIETSIPLDKYQVLCGQVRRQIYPFWTTFACIGVGGIWVFLWAYSAFGLTGRFVANQQWAVIIVLLALILSVVSFYKIVIPWLNRVLPSRSGVLLNRSIDGTFEVTLDDITFSDEYSYSKIEWAGFHNVFDMPGAVGLYKSPLTYLIPNDSFESREKRQEFIAFCKTQIAAHKEG